MVIKRMFTCLCCILLLLCLTPTARAKGMTATIATGPVVMNGQKIDSATARYPLLVYNNITYVPMTFDLCRFMGLATGWDNRIKTLYIDRSRERWPYVPDTGYAARSGEVTVTRAMNPIVVCDVPVDNSVESHPLLLYSGVTYFPLTFDYIVHAFGWTYTWDGVNGLNITSLERPEPPSVSVHTGDSHLDEALWRLNAFYRLPPHTYAGTLTGPDGSVQTFEAHVDTETDFSNIHMKLTADPFVFFENGISVDAQYDRYMNLTDDPAFGHEGGWSFRDVPDGPYINLVPPDDLSRTETGYLARCFLDCQFSGARAGKIQSASKTAAGSRTVWKLTVAFAFEDFAQYDAAITLDGGVITAIEISTENYTLRMAVKGE